jgi:hypothetical protein
MITDESDGLQSGFERHTRLRGISRHLNRCQTTVLAPSMPIGMRKAQRSFCHLEQFCHLKPFCHLVSPRRVATTRPPTHPPRVVGGGGSTPRPSVTLASPARRPVPHTAPYPLLLLHYSTPSAYGCWVRKGSRAGPAQSHSGPLTRG